jgi:SAM-dependent methyltransferase
MRSMGLDYQEELLSKLKYSAILSDFHSLYYLRINQRRQEHLVTLGLDLRNKNVWEVSAGIGDHTSFFLDRDCRVTCSEVRPELIEILRHRYPKVPVCELNLEEPDVGFRSEFDIVYCYGLLYHLKEPARALRFMAERCRGKLLLETCVSLGTDLDPHLVAESAGQVSQAFSGIGCRPTRSWIFNELRSLFPFVYLPLTQPNHEQFPVDWQAAKFPENLIRSIFIASRQELRSAVLTKELILQQSYH